MKADELRLELKELEADIRMLLNRFIQNNGACAFDIHTETKISDATQKPTVIVSIGIGI